MRTFLRSRSLFILGGLFSGRSGLFGGLGSAIPSGAILERSGNAIVDRSGAYILTRA